MSERRKIEERVRKKEAEIQALEAQIQEAKVYLQALNDVLKMFPKEAAGAAPSISVLRPGSLMAQARDVILKHGSAMHISDLVKELGKEPTRENRASLGGSLAAYVRRGEIFTRPAPNHFGLVELGEDEAMPDSPPEDFGALSSADDDTPF